MSYIDKEYAIAAIKRVYGDEGVRIISNMPNADVVKVVKCKNCRYRFTRSCPMLTVDQNDGFCSRGKSYN